MSSRTQGSRSESIILESPADGLSGLPARLALAILSLSRRLWLLLFVLVPIGVLLASHSINEQFANGIVGICGFLALILWATGHYTYDRAAIRIDPASRTLAIRQRTASLERTVDLERVDSISVRTLGPVTLLRIEAHALGPIQGFTLPSMAVPTNRLSAALEAFDAAGVAVPDAGRSTRGSLETRLRLLVTALVLVGVPLAAVVLFGRSVLATNGAALVAILGLSALAKELWTARTAPQSNPERS